MRRNRFILAVGLLFVASLARAEESPPFQQILKDLAEIKAEIAKTQKEITEIKVRLGASPQPASKPIVPPVTPPVTNEGIVPLKGGHTLGSESAPLALIEYLDFQCPFCARFHKEVLPKLKKAYIDTGKLLFIHRDLPLIAIHAAAQEAAEAAYCSGPVNYWKMVDLFFSDLTAVREKRFLEQAVTLGLDQKAFKACLEDRRHTTDIQQGVDEAQRLGIRGTPGFVLGKIGQDGMVTGKLVRGAKPFTDFQQEIDRLLSKP